MNIKRFIFNRIFNQRQRDIIWNAIVFSQHTYRMRGQIDNAAVVQQVLNEVKNIFFASKSFTQDEVNAIIGKMENSFKAYQKEAENKVRQAYEKGVIEGVKKASSEIQEEIKKMSKPSIKGCVVVVRSKNEEENEEQEEQNNVPDAKEPENNPEVKENVSNDKIPAEGKESDEIEK